MTTKTIDLIRLLKPLAWEPKFLFTDQRLTKGQGILMKHLAKAKGFQLTFLSIKVPSSIYKRFHLSKQFLKHWKCFSMSDPIALQGDLCSRSLWVLMIIKRCANRKTFLLLAELIWQMKPFHALIRYVGGQNGSAFKHNYDVQNWSYVHRQHPSPSPNKWFQLNLRMSQFE